MKTTKQSHARKAKAVLQIFLLLAIATLNLGPIGANTAYAAAPGNDDWLAVLPEPYAITDIDVPFTNTVVVDEATAQTGEPKVNVLCDGKLLATGDNTVWYTFTTSTSKFVSFDTVGSKYEYSPGLFDELDTYLAVWTGTTLGNLTLVGCDDDNDIGFTSQFAFNAQAGTTYYVQIAKYNGTQGGAPDPDCSITPNSGDPTNCSITFNVKYQTFVDVPPTHPYFQQIEALYAAGYTGGCQTTPLMFCPSLTMDRAQSAVFMLRGNFGSGYVPVTPIHFFKDNWSRLRWAEGWAESMYLEGLTAGCKPSPLQFCPNDILTNAQIAVFGLRLKYGMSYQPPLATGTLFADMKDPGFWATSWAEQAYLDGLIPACGTDLATGKPKFCPNALVDRGFGSYVIVTAKNLLP